APERCVARLVRALRRGFARARFIIAAPVAEALRAITPREITAADSS
ncbi:MAG: hypothetical protein H7124_12760, partial [Phycisphaerales bacterium]|nr:hypothetical protein [Hyphomonadaceae bacterium]